MMAAHDLQPLRGKQLRNEPMSRHTSWRVGGPADWFYTPADIQDLALFLSALDKNEPVMFLGLGSNLLVRDKGIRGAVIALKGSLAEIEPVDDTGIRVGAGVSCAKLARYCHRNNLVDGEFFAGIPGLLGGALAMNAGAFGGETWKQVESVLTIDMDGNIRRRTADEYTVAYRNVSGPQGEWFIQADLRFTQGDGEKAAERVRQLLQKRSDTQPTGLPSCGSVFKNPQGDYAARLIEASGLKGYRIGGAEVSEKHANFIINTGTASAADIEQLIAYVQQQVKLKQGVDLHTEVRIIGESADD